MRWGSGSTSPIDLGDYIYTDTYPIDIDEDSQHILDILKLVQALSNKYGKPLSARFISSERAKIGERTDFKNEYLKDVVVRMV